MPKPQTAFDGALAIVEGMDDVLFDAWMLAKLLDHLVSHGLGEHRDGYYSIAKDDGDLIAFASLKAVAAVRACQNQLVGLDPRGSVKEGA